MAVSGEDTIRPNIARLFETTCLKVGAIQGKGILVMDGFAGYLAENDIIAFKSCDN